MEDEHPVYLPAASVAALDAAADSSHAQEALSLPPRVAKMGAGRFTWLAGNWPGHAKGI
jgi:hypothetical protein